MSEIDEQSTRICRKCSVAATTAGDFCPSCGTSYVGRSRRPTRRGVIITAVVVLLLAGAGTAFGVKQQRDAAASDRAQAAAERQERRAAEVAAKEQTKADESERAARADLVKALEKQVTKDAKKKVDDDLLDGPILYSNCTATGGGSTDDLTALTGTFECIAVNTENSDGTASGYRYAGTAEWDTGSITWKLGS